MRLIRKEERLSKGSSLTLLGRGTDNSISANFRGLLPQLLSKLEASRQIDGCCIIVLLGTSSSLTIGCGGVAGRLVSCSNLLVEESSVGAVEFMKRKDKLGRAVRLAMDGRLQLRIRD